MNPIGSPGSAIATAQSGLAAAQTRLDVVANNIANLNTEGFKGSVVTQQAQPGGGVKAVVNRRKDAGEDYLEERVEALKATYDFKANLKVIETADEMIGSLLDLKS